MTKAYLMGFIARVSGKDIYSYANHWWNPFASEGYLAENKQAFEEFERGWNDADHDGWGVSDIMDLSKP